MSDLDTVKKCLLFAGFKEDKSDWANQLKELIIKKDYSPFDKEEYKEYNFEDLELFCYGNNVTIKTKNNPQWIFKLLNNVLVDFAEQISFNVSTTIYHFKKSNYIQIDISINVSMVHMNLNLSDFFDIFKMELREIKLNDLIKEN